MGKVFVDITMSLDGYIAGPDPTLEAPLGTGGERLHEWAVVLKGWREPHGMEGGEVNDDSAVAEESIARARATILGRKMFSGGSGPWADDPNAEAWWGDNPPYHHPVFVLTHHEREPVVKEGGTTFTFVTTGPEAALDLARAAAGDGDISVAGGAAVVQQFLTAGLVDELQIHVAPVLLGGGVRLLKGPALAALTVEADRVLPSPAGVAHLRYRITR
jgi:dihydrofolate reductase